MPALWPTFIPALASDIAGQSFTKPGGAIVSYELPKVGTDQVPIFPPSKELVESVKPGNPANAALTTNAAAMINAINLNPLSGRYDFGVRVAERYLAAIKGLAMTPFGATHTNNPAAEFLLKQGYGLVFERILREGDIPLLDQKDKDGNIIEMGKESHPAYADFCPEPIEEPDPIEEEKKQQKKFNKFVEDYKQSLNLYKFRFFEFECLDGSETVSDLAESFANRLLQQYHNLSSQEEKDNYKLWATSLGKSKYNNLTEVQRTVGGTYFVNRFPYVNVSEKARTDIEGAGYDWQALVDGVSSAFEAGLDNFKMSDCPLSEYKIQVSFDREHNLPDYPSKRPKILTDHVVALFSYDNGSEMSFKYSTSDSTKVIWWKKDNTYVNTQYEKLEYDIHWSKIPGAIKSVKSADDIINISPSAGGTIFKFQRQQVIDAKKAADECDTAEDDVDINFSWPGGDPYEEMAEITIAYWYACLVKPFAPSPSALPALIPPPLTGIYIPIYYGGKKRLAKNLRRAWNTGKTFSVLPAPQPPALAVSAAVAAAYALHLLEFKLLYLGGIPTPFGPVPMVGFVPVVF
jgi:hypothetical protein